MSIAECSVEGCTRNSKERGLCHGHYQRLLRLGHVQADRPLGRKTEGTCAVQGCHRTIYAKVLCAPHYSRQLAGGDLREHQPLRPPAGDRHISHGYFVVNVPPELRYLTGGDSQALEHRFVMAQMLGDRYGLTRVSITVRATALIIDRPTSSYGVDGSLVVNDRGQGRLGDRPPAEIRPGLDTSWSRRRLLEAD